MSAHHPKTTLPLESSFRFLGRSAWNESKTERVFWHASSGFEIAFRGTAVALTLLGRPFDQTSKTAVVGIWIDDLDAMEPLRTVVLSEAKTMVEWSGLAKADHVLRLIKRSEAADSTVSLAGLATDGCWLASPLPKPKRIEVLGASNSCGYGILGRLGEPKTTANSTVFRTYAFQAGRLLNADVSIIGASGWGVNGGYNTGGAAIRDKTLPFAYDFAGIDPDGNVVVDQPWNHQDQVYQAVVLNMGSNDFNAGNYSQLSPLDQSLRKQSFRDAYIAFLKHLRGVHPTAWIVCTYGMTGEAEGFRTLFEAMAEEANRQLGRVVALEMNPAGSNQHPFGSDYHPNADTHLENAKLLANLLETLL